MTSKKILMELHQRVLDMLRNNLPPELSYHNYEHTVDVLNAVERIAMAENTTDAELMLLKTAAVFHDTGYIYSRDNHEQRSCTIAREILREIGADEESIEKVCEIILATRIPQEPKDKLSEIMCDADLDYLGRDDYFPISQKVFSEFKMFGIIKDEIEWIPMQVKFLESHHYFTQSSINTRAGKKEENLIRIKENHKKNSI